MTDSIYFDPGHALGFFGIRYPEEYGGSDMDTRATAILVMERDLDSSATFEAGAGFGFPGEFAGVGAASAMAGAATAFGPALSVSSGTTLRVGAGLAGFSVGAPDARGLGTFDDCPTPPVL